MSLLDVASLVEDYDLTPELGPLKIERRAAPSLNTLGERVRAAATFVRATPWTAHTATGRVLQQLPEADRNTETIAVYVQNARLYVADASREPDFVHFQGRRWRVTTVNNYSSQGGVFFALAVLADTQDPS